MHSIERYGIVALLFLVVTIVAVLLWDGKDEGQKQVLAPPTATAKAPAGAGARPAQRNTLPAARSAPLIMPGESGESGGSEHGDRMVLTAAAQPGPLTRGIEQQRSQPELVRPEPTSSLTLSTPRPENASFLRSEPEAERSALASPASPAVAAADYVVRPGDTLSEIAQKQLGSTRRWKEIVALNSGLDPNKVRVGQSLRLPAGASVQLGQEPGQSADRAAPVREAAQAPVAKGKTYKVAAGDSLWRIAQRTLGDGSRWREIAALNPKVDPDRLAAGIVLVLPGEAKASAPAKSEVPRAERPPVVASRTVETTAPRRERGGKVQ